VGASTAGRRHRPGRRAPGRAGTLLLVPLGVLAYASGLGPALVTLLLIPVTDAVRDHGSRALRTMLIRASGFVALGQIAVALGFAPSLLDGPLAHGVAALGLAVLWAVGTRITRFAQDREAAHARLTAEEAHVRALLAHASDVTLVIADAAITYQSPSAEHLLGYPPGSLLGVGYLDLIHPEDRARTVEFVRDLLRVPGGSGLVESRIRAYDGSWVPVESNCRNLLTDPEIRGFVVNSRDVSDRKVLEQELEHRSLHDPMTGLANRALLLDRLQHAAARTARTGNRYAVLFVDVDDFKPINDTLGPAVGDAVLTTIAQRLTRVVRSADTVARIGGDEFAILLEDGRSDADAAKAAGRILAAMARPIHAGGTEVEVTASIGIAYDEGGLDPAHVLRNADIAMYLAKRGGKDRFEIFETAMHVQVVERLQLEADLHRAITADQLHLHFQPIVTLSDRRTVGLEALARWEHPERGSISPGRFIPLAEETGLIVPIGRHVLREACRQLACWRARIPGADQLTVSVNVSMRQLLVGDLVEDVRRALLDAGLPAPALTLELTESSLATDTEQAIEALRRLKALGVRLAIDDFGTGYSSLAYLHRFPVDVLKIDRSFVSSVASGQQSPALARAIVDLGRSLDLVTLAEGLEHELELAQFQELNCSLGQGYLFARPAEPATIERYLTAEFGPVRAPAGARGAPAPATPATTHG
jgi:diguanylate cyclase (GGDEF)-like protein/PAS domain S-box-containing protein